ncbi:unnamed protein product [Anisakis simplex]|uniref:Uncharacterized protein n=1 Tax=Anisakis simplex TaxID=6269 RepID=A0A3P6MZW7_ANISI|nr:unnamed protein product [Anisakis simplex]
MSAPTSNQIDLSAPIVDQTDPLGPTVNLAKRGTVTAYQIDRSTAAAANITNPIPQTITKAHSSSPTANITIKNASTVNQSYPDESTVSSDPSEHTSAHYHTSSPPPFSPPAAAAVPVTNRNYSEDDETSIPSPYPSTVNPPTVSQVESSAQSFSVTCPSASMVKQTDPSADTVNRTCFSTPPLNQLDLSVPAVNEIHVSAPTVNQDDTSKPAVNITLESVSAVKQTYPRASTISSDQSERILEHRRSSSPPSRSSIVVPVAGCIHTQGDEASPTPPMVNLSAVNQTDPSAPTVNMTHSSEPALSHALPS